MVFILLVLSACAGAAAIYPYARDIIRGRTRPRLITWGVWTFLAGIMTISAIAAGELSSAVLSAQGLIGCGLVVILGWRQGNATFETIDIASLVGAVIGLGALIVLREPTVALLVAVGVDAIAFAPTFRHAWTDPGEESVGCYAINIIASGLALLAAIYAGAGFIGMIYPIYSVTFNSIMALLLVTDRPVLDSSYSYGDEEA